MKEYTLIYTAEITEVVKSDEPLENYEITDVVKTDEPLENYVYSEKDQLGAWIESKLGADDVNVKNIKVFERDI